MTGAGVLEVVEVALPSLDAEVTCEAVIAGEYCGAVPVTHWAILTCTACSEQSRRPICARHLVEARVRWPDGVTSLVHRGCAGHALVEYVTAGGA